LIGGAEIAKDGLSPGLCDSVDYPIFVVIKSKRKRGERGERGKRGKRDKSTNNIMPEY
jgi:hypothetical protein